MWPLIFAAVMLAGDSVCSPNGRFCATTHDIVEPESADDDGRYAGVQIAERQSDGTLRPLHDIRFDQRPYGEMLVSDDGSYLVFVPARHRYGGVTIADAQGGVTVIPMRSFLTDNDIMFAPPASASWSIHNDRLVLTMLASIHDGPEALHEDVEIDLASGKLLTPKHDIYPPMRVFARAVTRDDPPPKRWEAPLCAKPSLTFASPDLMPVSSDALLAAATEHALPAWAELAKRRNVSGTVGVRLVVDEEGNVACIQTTPAFAALRDAVQQWKFRRFRSATEVHVVTGELMIELRRVEHAEWARIASTQ